MKSWTIVKIKKRRGVVLILKSTISTRKYRCASFKEALDIIQEDNNGLQIREPDTHSMY